LGEEAGNKLLINGFKEIATERLASIRNGIFESLKQGKNYKETH
jgi:hypothetical protein